MKMKWMGLYTIALAKETHARIIFGNQFGTGSNVANEYQLTLYNDLLAESKEEKENLIKLLDGVYQK